MSLKATQWVFYDAPKDLDAYAFRLLCIMSDAVDSEGRGAWKAVAKYAHEVGCSVRTIQSRLRELEERGLIRKGDQRIVAHIPANRRPTVYDLNINGDATAYADAEPDDADTENQTEASVAETETQVHEMHPKNDSGVHAGVHENDSGVHAGVHTACIQTSTKEEPLHKPESRAHARETRPTKNLHDWMPDRESIALADQLDADIAAEREKFRAKAIANGRRFANVDAAFQSWLRSGKDAGYLTPKPVRRQSDNRISQPKPHTHTHSWNCEHTLAALHPIEQRFDHERPSRFCPSEWELACQRKAQELNEQEKTA